MTSDFNNTTFYVPFWVLLEYLDHAPVDPFIKVYPTNQKEQNCTTDKGIVKVLCSDLIIKESNDSVDLIAYNVPLDYLIQEADLEEWSKKIADWFTQYAKQEKND